MQTHGKREKSENIFQWIKMIDYLNEFSHAN